VKARQRGVALLVAIIIFAIATMVAAAVTYNKAMAARRAAATFTLEQALQAGMAAEALASIALENTTGVKIDLSQDWAQEQPPLEIEGTGVWIQGKVEDLQGRFNLNSLVKWENNILVPDDHQLDVFRTLLRDLDVDVKYADLMADWIDTGIDPYGSSGGEDTLYLSQTPPYRPPNTFITHTSELLALPGFGRENYLKIAPYVTALPQDAPVNVCTASGLVLDVTLNEQTSQFAGQNLPEQRQKGCFPEMNTYLGAIGDATKRTAVQGHVDEKSRWFRLRTNIRIGTADFVLYSVLFREDGKKTRVVQRSFGSE